MRLPIAALLLVPTLLGAQVPVAPDARTLRLAEAGRLWSRLQWVHPALAGDRVDWDRALLEALPDLASATTPEAGARALHRLLDPLGDPAVTFGPRTPTRLVDAPPGLPLVAWLPGDVALLQLHRPLPAWNPGFQALATAAEAALPRSPST